LVGLSRGIDPENREIGIVRDEKGHAAFGAVS
jgi:hypothetical protein